MTSYHTCCYPSVQLISGHTALIAPFFQVQIHVIQDHVSQVPLIIFTEIVPGQDIQMFSETAHAVI